MDLYQLVAQMEDDGTLDVLINDPLMQFGPTGTYLGATLLPERPVPLNSYEESSIRWKRVIANSGERHSPAQIRRGGHMIGSWQVQTGSSDIAAVFDANDHDAIVNLLERNQDFEAAAFLSNWISNTVVEPLRILIEKERWQAIVNSQVVRTGDNGYYREINYIDPAGHRFVAGDTWLNDAYDPFDDLFAGSDLLRDAGHTVNRIIMRSATARRMSRHPLVRSRLGNQVLVGPPVNQTFQGNGVTQAAINSYLGEEGLPGITIYDETYETEEATYPFIPDGVVIMLSTTDIDETVTGPAEAGDVYLPNTLGYTAIGRPSGEETPGRASVVEVSDRKPRTITAEAWQETLPVITRPSSIAVISGTMTALP